MTRTIKHAELDEHLDRFAQDPETYEKQARRLIARYDKAKARVEITDPSSWRKPAAPGSEPKRLSLRQQFRAEIDAIEIMDREEEARLARRIEFCRWRLDKALEENGISQETLVSNVGHCLSSAVGPIMANCGSLPPRICRRWIELHALRMELVERNLYLALINVERYAHTTANPADLIQEGSAALFRAVDGFDWRRGLLFRTYAVHWLNQAFRSYLYNFSNTVRVPVYLQKALKHVNDAKARLGDHKAEVEDIAEAADMPENLVASAIAAARSSRSLDIAFDNNDEGGRLKDVLEFDDGGPYTTDLEDVSLEEGLGEALSRLSDRERYVVEQRFGVHAEREHTLAEVAGELGVSLERIRQIQVRALNKMRTPGLRKVVDPFLN